MPVFGDSDAALRFSTNPAHFVRSGRADVDPNVFRTGLGGIVDRQLATGSNLPVQSPTDCQLTVPEKVELPVQSPPNCLSTDSKEVTLLTVQANPLTVPELGNWRQTGNEPPMPRSFTCVPHLRLDGQSVTENGKDTLKIEAQTVTGWQIQWSTVCTVCKKRFRPVAGFLTPRQAKRIMEVSENEQKAIVRNAIRRRFDAGRVSGGHSACVGGSGS